MTSRTVFIVAVFLFVGIAWALSLVSANQPATGVPNTADTVQSVQAGEYRISGPYIHENLTVFLIHGKDQFKNNKLLTLGEALEQKKVIVHETQTVSELKIENISQNEDIYIQSGDIVKGGRQDRVLAVDLIVPPGTGPMPVAAFCVEESRWSQRTGEELGSFSVSSDMLATKDLKRAVKETRRQGDVWKEVATVQVRLNSSLGENVKSSRSESSLQLTLENKKVQEVSDQYMKVLSPIAKDKPDVIGYAFAVNGKLSTADIYGSTALFVRLWPKLLKSSTIEAIAEFQKDKKFPSIPAGAVKTLLADAEKGKLSEEKITERIKMLKRETEKEILFETLDLKQKEALIHRNYVTKQ